MPDLEQTTSLPGTVQFIKTAGSTLTLKLSGGWLIRLGIPSASEMEERISEALPLQRLVFDMEDMTEWDSGLLIFLMHLLPSCRRHGIAVDEEGLRPGVRRLLHLALAVPEKEDALKGFPRWSLLTAVGGETLKEFQAARDLIAFIGDATLSIFRFFRGRSVYRRVDLIQLLRDCGARALPIVSLISFLVGLILAFVGAIQLKMFGAQIYVANLVGIAMAREMGAMMTGIIMAGRTGAAFAAQLGTMQVNQEIDALKTLGISPTEFLVVPRMLALILMMPLLCMYSDFVGILGGFVVGIGMLNLSFMEFFNQTRDALDLMNFSIGIMKSMVFGVLIALSGCLRGIQCERSASAVGFAATSAVVTAIVWIIVSDAIFAVVTEVIGI